MPAPCGAKERGNCQRSRSGGGGRSARRTWGGQGPRREDHARRGVVGSHKLVKVVRRQRLRTDIRFIRVRGQRAASGPCGPSRPGGGGGGGCAGRRAAHGEVRRGGNQLVPQSAGEGGDVDRLCERGAALGQTGAAGETEAAPRLRRGAAPPGGRKPEAGFASISTLCGLASSAARSAFTFASCSQPTGFCAERQTTPPHTLLPPPAPLPARIPAAAAAAAGARRAVSLTTCRSYFGLSTASASSSTASGRCVFVVSTVYAICAGWGGLAWVGSAGAAAGALRRGERRFWASLGGWACAAPARGRRSRAGWRR